MQMCKPEDIRAATPQQEGHVRRVAIHAQSEEAHRGCCRSVIETARGVRRAGARAADAHGEAEAARERQGADSLLREVAAADAAQAVAGVDVRLRIHVG